MKIVRLTENNGQTAFFDNTFNDEIELPPFSEVALSSVSINTDEKSINIQAGTLVAWDRGAAKSSMDSGGAAGPPGQFTPGTYTDTTHANFLMYRLTLINGNRTMRVKPGGNGQLVMILLLPDLVSKEKLLSDIKLLIMRELK